MNCLIYLILIIMILLIIGLIIYNYTSYFFIMCGFEYNTLFYDICLNI
uniref:Uncharacterized protein n=1 Tax=Faxonius propinquus nudivirus TaxID=3139431 RepID=A0AAU8GF79_9VIRU